MPDHPSTSSTARTLARHWRGQLAHFHAHRNDEHIEALIDEARRFCGFQLENRLSRSAYWSGVSLLRRVAVLLFLVDRGVIQRRLDGERALYEATPGAEAWASAQPALTPYLAPTLELIEALRDFQARRLLRASSGK
jgi:hypothetical protein